MSTEIVRAAPIATNLPDMVRYADHLANAQLLPKQFAGRPANVLWAMEYGRTLGITPLAAITGIHVIEGKPSASAALISGLVRQAGHKLRVRMENGTAVATIIRSDDPDYEFRSEWDIDRANAAGLTGKDVWKKYPQSMLKARAITEVARDACEEVLFGLHYTPEELGAVIDQDGNPVDAPVQPLRVVDAQPVAEQRDLLAEARSAADAEKVRQIYREASAGSVPRELLDQIAEIGREKAAQPTEAEPVEAEAVEEQDEHALALDELRAAAVEKGLATTLDSDFQSSYGVTPTNATVPQLRDALALIRAAA